MKCRRGLPHSKTLTRRSSRPSFNLPLCVFKTALQFPLGAGELAGDAGVVAARGVHGAGEGFEERLDDVVRFVAVEEFKVEIAAGFVGEALKEFAREAEAEDAGQILRFFGVGNFLLGELIQAAPDEVGASAEIHDAAGETFVHRDVGFAGERILRMKAVAVAADAALVAERGGDGLAERDATVFDGVVRVHFQVAIAAQIQIHCGVLGEEGEHVIEEREARLDLGFAFAVEVEADGNPGFEGVAI